jgi:5-formyltetrahydrofolate cyclo-ligase
VNPLDRAPHSHTLAPEGAIRHRVKAEIRKRMRGLRKTTPASACAERSRLLVLELEKHPDVVRARSVALFWPIEDKHEVDLRPLDASLRARGVKLYYPAIDRHDDDPDPEAVPVMTFRRVDDPARLADPSSEAGNGFAEPAKDAPEAGTLDIDVIVVPAIAIAPSGHRIGYGAGYYDRTLPRWSGAVTIGVAFDFQLIVEVPTTDGDVPLAWIVTDKRTLQAGA